MEDQLLELNAGGQPEASGPSATSTGALLTIPVSVPREKRFRKYSGISDDRVLEDWIADAERAVRGQTDAEVMEKKK